jgi:hypothetical protein
VPVWGLATAVARRDGGFTIIYQLEQWSIGLAGFRRHGRLYRRPRTRSEAQHCLWCRRGDRRGKMGLERIEGRPYNWRVPSIEPK